MHNKYSTKKKKQAKKQKKQFVYIARKFQLYRNLLGNCLKLISKHLYIK